MAKNAVQLGDILSLDPGATTSSGDLHLFSGGAGTGPFVGVMLDDGVSGTNAAVGVRGVYAVKKTAGTAWTVGQALYYKASDDSAITLAAGNTPLGVCVAAAASGATIGSVYLRGPAMGDGGNVLLSGQVASAAATTATATIGTAYNGKVVKVYPLTNDTPAANIASAVVATGTLTVTHSASCTAKTYFEILEVDVT